MQGRRREFLGALAGAPAFLQAWNQDPANPAALQFGDVNGGRAIVWARSPRAARMTVRWRTTERPTSETRLVRGPALTALSDFTGRVELSSLPAGQRIFVEVELAGLDGGRGEPLLGHFQTPGAGRSPLRLLWSGDMVGQGWGINPDWGGIRIFETMRRLEPHLFLHSGDTIYADNPVPVEVGMPGGKPWRNVVTEAKSKVAETLDEFRGCYRYNLLDENVRRFSAEVAQLWQWDDHEITNNWSPSKDLSADARYREKNIQVLVDRGRQAFLEFAPMLLEGNRIYRKIPCGPLLDVFLIDMRSYRGPNTYNRQDVESAETAFLGNTQTRWLAEGLRRSRAAWKIVAADMPVGLIVGDGKDKKGRPRFENCSNGDGPALGREIEIARLLSSIKRSNVRNIVWLTADVHYTAAHHYDPARARFTDFLPFHEFVSGPLNAGTFGPGALDNTFGPQVLFQKAPPPSQSNLPPSAGMQFFGEVRVGEQELTVVLRDSAGDALYSRTLALERG